MEDKKSLFTAYKLHFILDGASPVLLHNAASMSVAKTGLGRKTIPTPEEEAAASVYKFPDDTLGFPAIGIRSCILSGAKGLRFGRMGAVGVLSGALDLMGDELFPFVDPNGEPIKKYIIDIRRAMVQRQGIMRARPKVVLPWSMPCVFMLTLSSETDVKLFLERDFTQVISRAGQAVGMGDFRPEKKGWFGKFTIRKVWEEPQT